MLQGVWLHMPFVCVKGRILRRFIVLLQLDVVTDALLLLGGENA